MSRHGLPFCQFWASYAFPLSNELGRGTRQTDRQTDRQTNRHRPSFRNVLSSLPTDVGGIIKATIDVNPWRRYEHSFSDARNAWSASATFHFTARFICESCDRVESTRECKSRCIQKKIINLLIHDSWLACNRLRIIAFTLVGITALRNGAYKNRPYK